MSKPDFSTGLCDLCAEPGGAGLCFITACCHCFVAGKNGEYADGIGGYWGSCLGTLVPMVDFFCICDVAQKTLQKKHGAKADDCMMGFKSCCCGACVMCQTRREQVLMGAESGYFPGGEQSAALMKKSAPTYGAARQ